MPKLLACSVGSGLHVGHRVLCILLCLHWFIVDILFSNVFFAREKTFLVRFTSLCWLTILITIFIILFIYFILWTLIFFSPPLHRCLSEKEIQLECLFDGEIGSVVSHSFFILRPAPSLRLFSPPPGPSTPSDSFVCFALLGQRCWRTRQSSVTPSLPAVLLGFSLSPSAKHPASPPAMTSIQSISSRTRTNMFSPPYIERYLALLNMTLTQDHNPRVSTFRDFLFIVFIILKILKSVFIKAFNKKKMNDLF